ncbi:unnamed protein product [Polarella glacialis]|uniref:PDZ domain-containing protein n=1 Tax=Polarella glacialis TaxID=89957 RepID=A0A813G3P9_POLGL|nr:unnamed protein product [Polarella glacialis]
MAPGKEDSTLPSHPVPASVMQMMAKVKLKTSTATPERGTGLAEAIAAAVQASSQPASASASAAGKDDRPAEFTVELDMTGVSTGLGLEVDWADGKTLYIKGVKAEGGVPNWNKSQPKRAVRTGDRVISINGKVGDPKAMLGECKKTKKLSLLVRTRTGDGNSAASASPRSAAASKLPALPAAEEASTKQQSVKHFEWNVTLDLSSHSTKLGLDVDWADGKCLYIREIQPGAVEDWNRQHPPHLAVHNGNRIMAVNGFAEDGEAMAGLCRELTRTPSQLISLRIRGCPPPPPEVRAGSEARKGKDDRDRKDKRESEKEKDRDKDRDRDKEKDRSKNKDQDKERDKDKDREKDRDKGKRKRSEDS